MRTRSLHSLAFGAAAIGLSAVVFPVPAPAQDEPSAQEKAPPFGSRVTVDEAPPRRVGGIAASYADMLDRIKPAIVSVFTTKKIEMQQLDHPLLRDPFFRRFFGPQLDQAPEQFFQPGLGSGVVITPDGYILTNNHVVEGADEIKVKFAGNKKQFEATVVGTDPQSDVAVIKIEAEGLAVAPLADSTKVRVGDIVLAIGSPLNYEQTVTMGIVSALGRSDVGVLAAAGGYENFIQTDASINPGNSGGALVDVDGRVIGINTAIASRSGGADGIGFAIPVTMALEIAEAIVDEGEVQRGFLGVGLDNLNENLARAFGKENLKGALVTEVVPGSPAEQAGLESGDIIVEFEGREVDEAAKLRLDVGRTRPGAEVAFKVLRDGEPRDIRATLAKRDAEAMARRGGGLPDAPEEPDEFLPGVEVANLDDAKRQAFDLDPDLQGVLVTSVVRTSAASAAGLQEGDVIIEVDKQPVRNVTDAMKARKGTGGDILLLRVVTGNRGRYVAVEIE